MRILWMILVLLFTLIVATAVVLVVGHPNPAPLVGYNGCNVMGLYPFKNIPCSEAGVPFVVVYLICITLAQFFWNFIEKSMWQDIKPERDAILESRRQSEESDTEFIRQYPEIAANSGMCGKSTMPSYKSLKETWDDEDRRLGL